MALSPNQVEAQRRSKLKPSVERVEASIDLELVLGQRVFYRPKGVEADAWLEVLSRFQSAGWRIQRQDDPSGRESPFWRFS